MRVNNGPADPLTPLASPHPTVPQYAEGEEDGEYYDEEYGEEEGGEDRGFGLAREEHMKGALMIQKAACLEMIGQDAYNQL